jgi:hypothetical protein
MHRTILKTTEIVFATGPVTQTRIRHALVQGNFTQGESV